MEPRCSLGQAWWGTDQLSPLIWWKPRLKITRVEIRDFGYELPSVPAQHTASTLILILQGQILLIGRFNFATLIYLFEGLEQPPFVKGSQKEVAYTEIFWELLTPSSILKKYTLQGSKVHTAFPNISARC